MSSICKANLLLLNFLLLKKHHPIHDVTPNVVAIAVIIDKMICKISFQVSFFMVVIV